MNRLTDAHLPLQSAVANLPGRSEDEAAVELGFGYIFEVRSRQRHIRLTLPFTRPVRMIRVNPVFDLLT
ncbi:hypothetical protein C7G42_07715 [Bradyrhizobium sp. MOS003]|nr:hypothetical protein C7G42_07715 [Bradyrhizobium sp. MOS003]